MEGVVVWTDRESRKAIIWCNDNGRLAWLSGWPAVRFSGAFPEIGDLLYIDVADAGVLRRVTRAFMKAPRHDPGIVLRLRAAVAEGAVQGELPEELRDIP